MSRITTPRLLLRPCTPEDRNDFMALERDPSVMRYLNGGYAVDHDITTSSPVFLMPRGDEAHVWTALLIESNRFIGWFCLWPDHGGTAELGYRLTWDAWGKGLATEGASALLRWGFETAGYTRIVASCMTVHHASRRIMEKIGLRYERTELDLYPDPIPGSEEGDAWYGLNRSDWKAPGSA